MAHRAVKPSQKAVERAWRAAILERLTKDEEYFRIHLYRRRQLVFFGGYYVHFEPYYNTVMRRGGDHRRLGTEDYTAMFQIAKMIFKAQERGDQEAIRERVQQATPNPVDTRQGNLFGWRRDR